MISLSAVLWIIGILLFFVVIIILFLTMGAPRILKALKRRFTPTYTKGIARVYEAGIEREYASTLLYETPIALTYRRNQKVNGEWVEDHYPLNKYNVAGEAVGKVATALNDALGCLVYRVALGGCVGCPPDEEPSEFPQGLFQIHTQSIIETNYRNSVKAGKGGFDWKIVLVLVGILALVAIVAMGMGYFKKPAPIIVNTVLSYNQTANTTQPLPVVTLNGTQIK